MAEPEDQIGVVAALVRTAFLVNAVYAESAREFGLTQQQGQLLCVLMPQAYAMGELSTILGLAKSSLTGLVDRTERNGLVRRGPDPRDPRGIRVTLTPAGAELADRFYTETCRRVAELPATLSDQERDTVAGLLSRVIHDNQVPVVFGETL
ncbi:MarR family transcriptional regulator [Actinoplanes hulinensis]|uniref:MarR family transcriptional regulator n=1 Tax=Actinoplanes hulinensis TaxID=1144547 RepID=A0ABS7BGT2_9ACTN|nr:MarR family transcriptional regulator [Actinoplanes hulinensis]MBW6440040.1 MarR family transcriptional regulator [Actinoplanes hulinensis]